ncbi:porin family protein [Myroides ceti]|uniref:Porin family protein n=1 Tax=Paenimyroides ceti TaxID=395087 RepID=A0ABT8CZX3_9FLAO|nr:porin family protein [Paenimyroides ceti]MDN3706486.1 porin family protein [Paenimyroides ceti]MDN3709785.1 porin family protein [Paenimyroides ceti]MDN3709795.1 porin family protein [Paenimyroides ceti]
MKKILLSVGAILAVSLAANAQDVQFGVKGGVNFANLPGSDVDNAKMKTGFHVGGFVEIPLSDQFSLQPEVLYSTQGQKGKILGQDYTLSLDYVNVPILAKYYAVENLGIVLGPQIGFLAKSEAETGDVSLDAKDGFKSVDIGIAVGAEYQLENGILFGARYNFGLTKVAEEVGNVKPDGKNGVIQVSVGYRF